MKSDRAIYRKILPWIFVLSVTLNIFGLGFCLAPFLGFGPPFTPIARLENFTYILSADNKARVEKIIARHKGDIDQNLSDLMSHMKATRVLLSTPDADPVQIEANFNNFEGQHQKLFQSVHAVFKEIFNAIDDDDQRSAYFALVIPENPPIPMPPK